MSAFLYQTARVKDDPNLLLAGASGLAVAHLAPGPRLFIMSQGDSGINNYDITPAGELSLFEQFPRTKVVRILGATDIVPVTLSDGVHLATTARLDSALQGFRFNAFGQLLRDPFIVDDVQYDPPDGESGRDGGSATSLFGADSIDSYEVAGVTWLVIGAAYDGGLALVRYLPGGTFDYMNQVFDDGANHLAGVEDIEVVEAHGQRFVVTVSAQERGVSVFTISDTGDFANVFNLEDGFSFSLGHLTKVETVEVAGQTYVVTAARGNWPLSVFLLESDGSLTLTDRVTGGDAVNIFNPYSLETFVADGKTFLAVGANTGGLSLFRIGGNGGLSLIFEDGINRPNRTAPTREITVEVFGDKILIITAGREGDGVTVERFFPAPKGLSVIGGPEDETLLGKFKKDVIIGDAGNDVMKGKSGGDLLIDGSGKDTVLGGPGRDTFEFTRDGQQDKLRDFQDDFDLIDLSAYPSVDSVADIVFEQRSVDTVLLIVEGENLFVTSQNAAPLTVADFTDSDFIFG